MSVFQVQAKDTVYTINQYATVNAMQNFSWDPTFNEEYLEELGNSGYVATSIEPEISGSFDVNATGSTVALLNRMIMNLDINGEFQGYRFTPLTPNTGTIRVEDLEYAVFDLIGHKKTNEVYSRSEFFPRLFLSSFTMSADASGNASDSYNFEGQLAHVYRAPFHDMISHPAIYVSSTVMELVDEDFLVDIVGGSSIAGATHRILAIQINERIFTAADIATVANAAGANPVTITFTQPVVVEGARIMVWAYRATPGTFPTIYNPVSATFMRANDIDIWLVPITTVDIAAMADGALMAYSFAESDFFLRLQSFDISVDMRRESLRQIKYNDDFSAIYYRAATYPLQVTASASAFESELEEWRKIIDAPAVPTLGYTHKLDIGGFSDKRFQIVARYYYNGTPIQTVAFTDAFVTGMSHSTSTGSRGEVNWSFTGSNIVIEGDDL